MMTDEVESPEIAMVDVPWHYRWRHAVAGLFSPERRRMTTEEDRLAVEVSDLKMEVAHLRQRVSSLEMDCAKLESEKKIHEHEIRKWTLVAERDRERVRADLALEVARGSINGLNPVSKPMG